MADRLKRSIEAATEDQPPPKQLKLDEIPIEVDKFRKMDSVPPEGRGQHIPGGVLTTLARVFASPAPCHDDVYVVVLTANWEQYFISLFNTITELVYPDFDPVVQELITQEHFVLVCRYLMKSRIDLIYGKYSGRRLAYRIPMPNAMLIPNALAIIINGIGIVHVNAGALTVIPQPEPGFEEAGQNLERRVTHAMLSAFARLIKAAANRSLIRTGLLSSIETGTAYWILTARNTNNPAEVAAQGANHCTVYGTFKEWTPSDAVLASLSLNQFNGYFGGLTNTYWVTDPSRAISGMRVTFNADA